MIFSTIWLDDFDEEDVLNTPEFKRINFIGELCKSQYEYITKFIYISIQNITLRKINYKPTKNIPFNYFTWLIKNYYCNEFTYLDDLEFKSLKLIQT